MIVAVVQCLNGFRDSTKFTIEREEDQRISFLDMKVIQNCYRTIESNIHRKSTDSNIYMNWNLWFPTAWWHKPILACTTYQSRRIRRAALTYLSSPRTRDESPCMDTCGCLCTVKCHLTRHKELVFSFYLCLLRSPWDVDQHLECFVMKNSLPPLFFSLTTH